MTPEEQTKLVERLQGPFVGNPFDERVLKDQSAKEIKALQKENARLREGFEGAFKEGYGQGWVDYGPVNYETHRDMRWLESEAFKGTQ